MNARQGADSSTDSHRTENQAGRLATPASPPVDGAVGPSDATSPVGRPVLPDSAGRQEKGRPVEIDLAAPSSVASLERPPAAAIGRGQSFRSTM